MTVNKDTLFHLNMEAHRHIFDCVLNQYNYTGGSEMPVQLHNVNTFILTRCLDIRSHKFSRFLSVERGWGRSEENAGQEKDHAMD